MTEPQYQRGIFLTRIELETLADILRLESHLVKTRDASVSEIPRDRLRMEAQRIYNARRMRDKFVPSDILGEPAWDIMLSLYLEKCSNHKVSSVSNFASCAPTTALRYIAALEGEGLIERTRHPTDRRITLVALSAQGKAAMENFLSESLRINF